MLVVILANAVGCGQSDAEPDPSPSPSPFASPASTPVSQVEGLIREDSRIIGPVEARVTLVEFLDPECEFCRAAFPTVKRLLAEYPEDLRLVVRYFPLHGNSVLAAQATEAAGEQGKYFEMQELLFTRQQEWGEKKTSQESLFVDYARQLGLDVEQFGSALQKPVYKAKIERDHADAVALGVRGTPTFFVNGSLVPQPGYAALKAAIDAALK